MEVDQIIAKAQAKAGGASIASESFREGLEILVADNNRSTWLSPTGREVIEGIYVDYLANRLRVDAYIGEHPEILDQKIERPVFIVGMPRTGTTMISYLLDADPARRSLLKWEIFDSVPPPTPETLRSDPRCLALKAQDEAMLALDPVSAAMHFEAADGPSECVFVHAQDFRSAMLEALSPAPTYADWILLGADPRPAYAHHKRVLQLLQSKTGGTWSLKMPRHALFIDTLLETYPDARIIWTHRDPYRATGSLCSLIGNTHRLMCGEPDRGYIGANYPRQMAEHVRRMMAFDAKHGEGAVYHLHYDRLTGDPLGEIARLYAWLGDELTDDAKAGMQHWLDANPQGRFGKHSYGLENYGLSVERLKPYFADYLDRYKVAQEAG